MNCCFVTDLHGHPSVYRKLFAWLRDNTPDALFIGGDILPFNLASPPADGSIPDDFMNGFLVPGLEDLKRRLKRKYPEIFIILGNDDSRIHEIDMLTASERGLWQYIHNRRRRLGSYDIYGYACIPPSPFQLKDWERYDLSRYIDPGAVSPEEGRYSLPVSDYDKKHGTIAGDLEALIGTNDLHRAIMLFHSPPYKTNLDRAALDGRMIDYVPLDVHIGSIAIRKMIESKQPLITLHGHVHESARLTGLWRDRIGRTHCFSAAHDGPRLALVKFDPADPEAAERLLL